MRATSTSRWNVFYGFPKKKPKASLHFNGKRFSALVSISIVLRTGAVLTGFVDCETFRLGHFFD